MSTIGEDPCALPGAGQCVGAVAVKTDHCSGRQLASRQLGEDAVRPVFVASIERDEPRWIGRYELLHEQRQLDGQRRDDQRLRLDRHQR